YLLLPKNKWGIPEPIDGLPVYFSLNSLKNLELSAAAGKEYVLVLVPCVAVSSQGYRLGYGRGYYDRYFRNGFQVSSLLAQGDLVGVTWEATAHLSFPFQDHDLRLRHILT